MFFSSEQRANTNVRVQTTTCPWFSRMFHNRNSHWLISDFIPKKSQKSKISENFYVGIENELEKWYFYSKATWKFRGFQNNWGMYP